MSHLSRSGSGSDVGSNKSASTSASKLTSLFGSNAVGGDAQLVAFASASSSGSFKNSAPAGFFLCKECHQTYPISELDRNRVNTCKRDALSYKSVAARWAKDKSLRVWWQAQSPDEKTAWYIKQQSQGNGQKRSCDELTHQEFSSKQVKQARLKEVVYIPYDIWGSRAKNQSKNKQQLEMEWNAKVADHAEGAIYENELWHLLEYQGIKIQEGLEITTGSTIARQTEVTSAEQLRDIMDRSSQVRNAVMSDFNGITMKKAESPFAADADPLAQPVIREPTDHVLLSMRRQVNARSLTDIRKRVLTRHRASVHVL